MAEFGFQSIGSSWWNQFDGQVVGSVFALSEDGTVTSMTGYFDTDSGTGKAKMALYAADGTLKGQTAEFDCPGAGDWVTENLVSPAALLAGDYFLVCFIEQVGTYTKYSAGDTNQGKVDPGNTYPTLPSPGEFADYGNGKFSIYATYAPGGAAATNVIYMII